MTRHTYSLCMVLIRLARGALSACESWVRQEFDSPTDKDMKHSQTVKQEDQA